MGLFDGKIKELGDTLSNNLIKRAKELEKEWSTEKDVGRSLALKITFFTMNEIAKVIQDSLNSD